jgi:hypothetical protein
MQTTHLSNHITLLILQGSSLHTRPPLFSPSRPHSLVQTHTHSIHRVDLAVKGSLEVTMRTQRFLDVTAATTLSPELNSFEPGNVFFVEEHVADGDEFLVDLVGVAGDDGAFGDDAVGAGGD